MADAAAAAEVAHDSDDEEASRDWDGDFSPAGQVMRGSASDDLTSPAARSDWASDGEEVLDARCAATLEPELSVACCIASSLLVSLGSVSQGECAMFCAGRWIVGCGSR